MLAKMVTALLAVLFVIPLTACNGVEAGLPSAQELIDGAVEAMSDSRTYKFEMDMNMDMAVEAEGERFSMNMVMDMNGAADITEEQMQADMNISMSIPDEGDMDMAMEMYIIDGMMYAYTNVPEMGDASMWLKAEVPGGMSGQLFEMDDYMELFEASDIRVTGSDTVRGIKCYRVDITPDIEELWTLLMQEAASTETGLPDIPDEFLQEALDRFSVRYWFAQDGYFLTKAEIEMKMELTPEALGFPGEEGLMTMDISMSLLAYDYNQPVSIELPPEAENAIEVSPDEMPF